jgi:hypothetical protein
MFIELLFDPQEKKQKLETKSKRSLTEAINVPDLLACVADFATAGERARGLAQVSRVFSVICTQSKAALLYKREVDREAALAAKRNLREPENHFNNAWVEYLIPLSLQPKHNKALCQVLHRLYRVDAQFEADVMDKKKSTLPNLRVNEASLHQLVMFEYHDVRNALLGHCLTSLAGSADPYPISNPNSDTKMVFQPLCCGHNAPLSTKKQPFLLCSNCKKHIKIWIDNKRIDWLGPMAFTSIRGYLNHKLPELFSSTEPRSYEIVEVIRFIVAHRSELGIN